MFAVRTFIQSQPVPPPARKTHTFEIVESDDAAEESAPVVSQAEKPTETPTAVGQLAAQKLAPTPIADQAPAEASTAVVKQYLDDAIGNVQRAISKVMKESIMAQHAFVAPNKTHDEDVLEDKGKPELSGTCRDALLLPAGVLDEPVEAHPLKEQPVNMDVHVN